MKLKTLIQQEVITEAKLNYAAIKVALEKAGVVTSEACVKAFMEGGDAKGFRQFMEDIAKIGYDDAATSFDENKEFWKKLGITKAQYNQACKDSL
mgnify:CR=1 FL=1